MASTEPVFAYLGPAGTYTDEAARAFAARLGIDEPNLFECASFDEVFDCVDRGKCEFGVVAKENSLEGSVTATLDNFSFKSSATILGEEVIDIHHCLVMHPDAKIEDVATVASHAQGLAQCRRFLSERLPGRSTITTSSTAESARLRRCRFRQGRGRRIRVRLKPWVQSFYRGSRLFVLVLSYPSSRQDERR